MLATSAPSTRDTFSQAGSGIGAAEAPVVGLSIRDVVVRAADTPAVIQHARDLTLDQVRVNGALLRR